ncbi:unnamed protein product [Brachionus calyciflorus]|uniref:G-protein coupled receptors family 1 profile domain-containing protein n=1 Tax=Brachionus calyciflorus TaxID=104777 RepID=A0A813QYF1_9BILA|nr:unnamed protein product [Brachionus calyciflorus]
MSKFLNDVPFYLRVIVLPFVISFGFVLNMLTFFVMRKIRNFSTTSTYMASLGLVNSGVLFVGGVSLWIHTINSNYSFALSSILTCKLSPFLFYTLADWSVFIIVIMTAERLHAVWKPLRVVRSNKKLQFKITMLFSVSLCSLINSHFILTHSVVKAKKLSVEFNVNNKTEEIEEICIDTQWHEFYTNYWIYIDATIYSFLPFCLLSIFNISIVRYLFKAADDSLKLNEEKFLLKSNLKWRTNVLNSYENSIEVNRVSHVRFESTNDYLLSATSKKNNKIKNLNLFYSARKLNRRIALMLLSLNVSFLIFSMPMVVLQIIYYSLSPSLDSGHEPIVNSNETMITISDLPVNESVIAKFDLIKAIAELLQYLNHSTNFFLYSVSGKTFRQETKKFFLSKFNWLRYFHMKRFKRSSKCSIRYSFRSV